MTKQYMKYIATGGVALKVNKELEKGARVVLMVPFLQTDNFGSYTAGYNVLFEEDEIANLQALEPKTCHWIPCSERLPKTADVYRVTRYYPNNVMNPQYIVDACCFDGSNTWYNDNRINHERAYADNVIAWQENPEPYKPQEREESK